MNNIHFFDLKQRLDLIPQYLELRNKYVDLLLAESVSLENTKEWLKSDKIELVAAVDKNTLVGVAILYLNRSAEVAFFVLNPGQGIGSRLLQEIEDLAKKHNLPSVWAWVLRENKIAARTFENNGYLREREETRIFKGIVKEGVRYLRRIG